MIRLCGCNFLIEVNLNLINILLAIALSDLGREGGVGGVGVAVCQTGTLTSLVNTAYFISHPTCLYKITTSFI